MLFNSLEFIMFFPSVILIYFLLPSLKGKNIWLVLASYTFYMWWNPKYVLLLLYSTVVTYFFGLLIAKCQKQDYKKKILICGIILVLSVLVWFKYINFIAHTITYLFGIFHINVGISQFNILLPIGISFFTFQSMSYMIDVYRGDVVVEKNFLRYALFIAFFPQLVAGPIERSTNLLQQFKEIHSFDYERAKNGFLLMLWGYFQKMVIADRIAIFVDAVYGNSDIYGGWYLIIATILFSIQIYCDFCGYSTIAVGASEIMGFHLMDNFKYPFFAKTVAQFWQKWHISLTGWFKDYIYIPLGGNRRGKLRKYKNQMTVNLISGIWHGASWHYVIWGGINGLFQIIGDISLPIRNKLCSILNLKKDSVCHRVCKLLVTKLLIDISWIFFRADNINHAVNIIKSIFTVCNPWILFDGSLYNLGISSKSFTVLLFSIGILLFADYYKSRSLSIRKVVSEQNIWFRWSFYIISMLSIIIFGVYGRADSSFIYFAF